MAISTGWILINIAYLTYLVSGLSSDMLRLRILWAISSSFFVAHGIVTELWPAVWWNIPVILVHGWMIARLMKQRRSVLLDAETDAIRTLIFDDLEATAFASMWDVGAERLFHDDQIITKGEPVTNLYLLIDGAVDVLVNENRTVRLSEYGMLGEISSISESMATATVVCNGTVRARVWNKEELRKWGELNPKAETALLLAMAREVSRKLSDTDIP